jgi:hypothetical protein
LALTLGHKVTLRATRIRKQNIVALMYTFFTSCIVANADNIQFAIMLFTRNAESTHSSAEVLLSPFYFRPWEEYKKAVPITDNKP